MTTKEPHELDRYKRLRGTNGAQYSIIEKLGKGKNGTVYLACVSKGEKTGRLCAIKLFHGDDANRRARFVRETSVLRTLEHNAIVRVLDDGELVVGNPFVVLEYWPHSLRDLIDRDSLTLAVKVAYALQLISALVYLKEKQIIHCDIKPDNVLVGSSNCVLADFGLATREGTEEEVLGDLDRTLVQTVVGDPRMPRSHRTPELVDRLGGGSSPITPASDMFQLGLLLYELFFLENPLLPPRKDDEGNVVWASPFVFRDAPSPQSTSMKRILERVQSMIELDPAERGTPESLLDDWIGIFVEVCDKTIELERRVFPRW